MNGRRLAGPVVAAAAVALVAGVGIVWPGLDAQQTPPRDGSAWVLQADGLRYARVNTVVGELDTIRSVSNPSRLVDGEAGAYMFTDSDSRLIRIDETAPVDLDADALASARPAPAGTVEVDYAGEFVAYRTDAGAVLAGRLSEAPAPIELVEAGGPSSPSDPSPGSSPRIDAISIDERGILMAYSVEAARVTRVDTVAGRVADADPVPTALDAPVLTAAGDDWMLVEPATGRYLARGMDAPAGTDATGTVAVQRSVDTGDEIYLADEAGLLRVPTDGERVERVFGDRLFSRGTPARPVVVDGEVWGAWLPEGGGAGALFGSKAGAVALDYGGLSLGSQRRPVFTGSGDALVLSDARSGWVWQVPDGRLLPSSQRWEVDRRAPVAPVISDQEPPPVLDPRPPVAVDDAFGVRAGALVALPVLLNDHDPNDDVLAIDAAAVGGLDPAFGTLTVTDDQQRLAVRVHPDASGSASFTYVVSDGTAPGGLLSQPATVTLTVADDQEQSGPQWCPVAECQQEWPSPQLARGGTVSVPVLGDWVDPEGDPLFLLSATDDSGAGQVAATPNGDVVFQHGGGDEPQVPITLTVADARGAETTRSLVVQIVDDPAPEVQSFAVLGTAASRLVVDVAGHVTGTAADVALTAARVLDDAAATATVSGGTTQFDFTGAAAGVYRVAVTVTADGREASGIVRITLLAADAPAQLSTSPVVAFVRPQADATVDVFAAVSNPTGRVLLLSEVVARPATGARLEADAVGQAHLRVAGDTATGQAGLLGTVSYRVSDGTEDESAAVQGEATVYLLPPASEAPPIAVDDAVTVRAGDQIDIDVLDNDVAASGARPRLDAGSVASSVPEALAFAAGDTLRYLAPAAPGDYTVAYRAFSTGSPALGDSAEVRVRVIGDEENRAPTPRSLSGRVLSGLSVPIPVTGFGMDPDGDVVRLDRIVSQPERGSAAISADGGAIVYTSVPGDAGQVEFTYRVVDAFGAAGEGRVRVGILSSDANPSPITYTDYVHVQAGERSVIRVHPLANDLDPMQGSLILSRVRPDVAEFAGDGSTTAEFTRLSERLLAVDDRSVTIAAGAEPGTMTFRYDVRSSAGNTARGLIVVRTVAERVPEYPVVADTVLTAADRDRLPQGIDVLSGKVAWSAGDPGALTLALWGEPDGISADGSTLRGQVGDGARIIPFSVTGGPPGDPITTYAFLRVPAATDVPLALRRDVPPVSVAEGEQVDFDISEWVSIPRGARLELDAQVRAAGARTQATCERVTATTVRYTAAAGAPWTDACLVPVRLAGGSAWTVLAVPVAVVPIDPQPSLRNASFEIEPGQTHTVSLTDLTQWRGQAQPISYRITGAAASFQATLDGTALTVRARDDAVPGTVEHVSVEVTSHTGVAPARITLQVGAPPALFPQGGTVQQQCSQASGSSCTIEVIGAAGEVNPLPATALVLVSVRPDSACTGVSFAPASATAVAVTWTPAAPGASCTAAFTVRDAQGRDSVGARDGRLVLDLQGYPPAPAALTQVGYGDGSVTLRVDPGPAQTASPALTGFEVRHQGAVVAQCTAQGVCPAIAAPNGEQRTYDAVAVNGVGPSQAAVGTVAWAYLAPAAPTGVTTTPVPSGAAGGVVALTVTGVDAAATGSLSISSPTGETISVPVAPTQTTVSVPTYRVGSNTAVRVTVTPVSRYEVPPGAGAAAVAPASVLAHGVGAATALNLSLEAVNTGGGLARITAVGTAAPGGDGAQLRYGIVPDGQTCRAGDPAGLAVFPNLPDGRLYTFVLCVDTVFDGAVFARATATAEVRAVQSGAAPTGYTFQVGPVAHVAGDRATWTIDTPPQSAEPVPNQNTVRFEGLPSGVFDTDPGIRVRYEHESGWWQSAWGAVAPAPGSPPTQVQARWWLETCRGGSALAAAGRSTGERARIDFRADSIRYYDQAGAPLPTPADPWRVPDGAARVAGVGVHVSWPGWRLDAATAELSAPCTPLARQPEEETAPPVPAPPDQNPAQNGTTP